MDWLPASEVEAVVVVSQAFSLLSLSLSPPTLSHTQTSNSIQSFDDPYISLAQVVTSRETRYNS